MNVEAKYGPNHIWPFHFEREISTGPLTVSMLICPFLDKLLQLPRAAKANLFGINR